MAKAFNNQNFQQEVLDSSVPVLVDFWAPWCGPCRMLAPVIDELAEGAAGYKVGKINVDENPELAQKYSVMAIPTLIIFKNGVPAKTVVGVQTKESLQALLQG